MSNKNKSEIDLKEAMTVMSMVDEFRFAQSQSAAWENAENKDEALRAHVKSVYESQGMEVSEQMIDEAIQAMREKEWEFHPPRWNATQEFIAKLFVSRDRWMAKVAISLSLASLTIGAIHTYQVNEKRDAYVQAESMERRLVANFDSIINQIEGFEKQVAAWDAGNPSLVTAQSALLDRLDQEKLLLNNAREQVPDWIENTGGDVDAWIVNFPDSPPITVEAANRWGNRGPTDWRLAYEKSYEAIQRADEKLNSFRQFAAGLDVVRSPLIQESMKRSAFVRDPLNAAIVALDANALRNQISVAQDEDAVWKGIQSWESVAPTLDDAEAVKVGIDLVDGLAAVKSAWETGNYLAAKNDLNRFQVAVNHLRSTYTLRLYNAPGDYSLVWRYFDETLGDRVEDDQVDEERKMYYAIVEALDASGNSVEVRIFDIEKNRESSARRFGVRIPKAVYEQLAADKTDNRVFENPTFGVKPRGKAEVEFNYPVYTGMIKEW